MVFSPTLARPLLSLPTVLCLAVGACAPNRIALPTGAGTPRADVQALFDEASAACRGVRTMTADLSLSGRVGRHRLRRRIQAGLAGPAAVRLEAPAPFGALFILAAPDERGTLLLVRDREVVRDAPVRDMLNALAGVALGSAELRALLSGCVAPSPRPVSAREYPGGVIGVDLDDGAITWIRREGGRWRISAGERGGLVVEYRRWGPGVAGTPRELRVRSASATAESTDLTVVLTQVEINVPLSADVFSIVIPSGVRDMTLDELRARGPLAD